MAQAATPPRARDEAAPALVTCTVKARALAAALRCVRAASGPDRLTTVTSVAWLRARRNPAALDVSGVSCDLQATISLDAAVHREGTVGVPFEPLLTVLDGLGDDLVWIGARGQDDAVLWVSVTSDRVSIRMLGLSEGDAPVLRSDVVPGDPILLERATLEALSVGCLPIALGVDESGWGSRRSYTYVRVCDDRMGHLGIAATDGYRVAYLHQESAGSQSATPDPATVLVPARALAIAGRVTRVMADHQPPVPTVIAGNVDGGGLGLAYPSFSLTVRWTTGPSISFPDVDRAIAGEVCASAVMPASALRMAVRTCGPTSARDGHMLRLAWIEGGVYLQRRSHDYAADVRLPAEDPVCAPSRATPGECAVIVAPRMLAQAAQWVVPRGLVRLESTGPKTPYRVAPVTTSDDQPSVTHYIAPASAPDAASVVSGLFALLDQ